MSDAARPIIAATLIAMSLLSCAGKRPANLGIKASRLAPCPVSPNCVSSDAQDSAHLIRPFELAVPPADAWAAARAAVGDLPRTKIIAEAGDYLHAECASAVFGFVDDLELYLRPEEKIIAVRSAARFGYSDFGVNRRRVENLRALLIERGVIR